MPKLNEKMIAALVPPPGAREVWASDTEAKGLRVRVTPGTPDPTTGIKAPNRMFYACWTDRATKERRRERLGVFGAITLEQARGATRAILGDVARGDDPQAKREARATAAEAAKAERALTLDALLESWAKLHLASKRPRYAGEAVRAIRHAFAGHLPKPAAHLSKAETLAVLDALVEDGKAAIAGRTLAYGRACYGWARKRGKVSTNPFEGLPVGAGAADRERVLADDELGRVWTSIAAMGQPWGPLLRVLLLTLVRRDEVAGMRWSELSPDLSVWTIPGSRMKRGQAHVVPLSDAAREALAAVARVEGQDLVFTTTGKTPVSGFSKVKAALDKACGVTDWRLHDFRRTGVSTLAGMGFNPLVADKLLAHQPSTLHGAGRVYQRHDFLPERKAALDAWAAHVLRSAGAKTDGLASNVAFLPQRNRA